MSFYNGDRSQWNGGKTFYGPPGYKNQASANVLTTSEQLDTWLKLNQGGASASGVMVSVPEALKNAAVSAAMKVLGESVAMLPLNIYRRNGKESAVATDIGVSKLLSTSGMPCPWMNSFRYREWGTRQIALRGNSYSLISRVGEEIEQLTPIHPSRVRVETADSGEPEYVVSNKSGQQITFSYRDIFHLSGPGDDPVTGDHVIYQNAENIGLALAQDRFAAKLFKNGANVRGTLEYPGNLSDDSYKRLKESFDEAFGGLENAHKAIILENGAKFSKTGMTFEEAQLVETRKLQRAIIASIWRIPPHMIGDLTEATFSNIENLARQFIDYVLMPWLLRWETGIHSQLLSPRQREKYYAKFNVSGLLRGNSKERAEYEAKMLQWGVMSPNEVREKEDMNPRDGGDEFYTPLNMAVNGKEIGSGNQSPA